MSKNIRAFLFFFRSIKTFQNERNYHGANMIEPDRKILLSKIIMQISASFEADGFYLPTLVFNLAEYWKRRIVTSV